MLSPRTFSLVITFIPALLAAGCGGSGSTEGSGGAGGQTTGSETGGSAGSGTGGAGGTFPGMTLTSTVLKEGDMFAADNTCAGANESPPLEWTAGPETTKSYAVILKDDTIGLVHSIIWDIPKDVLSLPANVEKTQSPANVPGARQTRAYDNQTFGYLGPCPQGAVHSYTFTVRAIDALPLPVAGIPVKDSVVDLTVEHELASATLSGQSDASPP